MVISMYARIAFIKTSLFYMGHIYLPKANYKTDQYDLTQLDRLNVENANGVSTLHLPS
jgi:hypothetical protein